MQDFLDRGDFRLVLVLDEVSAELERVVGYLDAITVQALTIDLITLMVYELNGAQVALPQRVSPEVGATDASGNAWQGETRGMQRNSQMAPMRFELRRRLSGESRTMFDELLASAEKKCTPLHPLWHSAIHAHT